MKTSTLYSTSNPVYSPILFHKAFVLKSFENWMDRQQAVWESNRLGISATGIFIQVTVAAVMIALLGMAGASVWIYTTGIFFAFLGNALALAQSSMKVILGTFVISILVNFSLILFYVLKMTGY